jgi:hypothetical protein
MICSGVCRLCFFVMRIIVLPATIGGNGLSQQLAQLTGLSS